MNDTIFRIIKRENPFVQIDKHLVNDNKLSWKTKGILIYLLSKPNGWQARISDIIKHATDGREAVRSAIIEAEKFGYIKRIEKRNESGQFSGILYQVFESPENTTDVRKSDTGKPYIGKPDTTNIDNNNKENINKDKENIKHPTKKKLDASNFSIFNDYKNGIESKETISCENGDLIIMYFERYLLRLNKEHPSIINPQMRKIINHINHDIDNVLNYKDMDDLLDSWFVRKDIETDYNINAYIQWLVELNKEIDINN